MTGRNSPSLTSTWSTAKSAAGRPAMPCCHRSRWLVSTEARVAGLLNPVCQGLHSEVPDRFGGSADQYLQQFLARLLCRIEPEHSPAQSGRKSRSVPLRTRVSAGRIAAGTIEEAGPHRSSQCAVCTSSRPGPGAGARKARDLAQRTFDITKKEQDLGAGSSYQTLSAQRDLSLAELDLVTRHDNPRKGQS